VSKTETNIRRFVARVDAEPDADEICPGTARVTVEIGVEGADLVAALRRIVAEIEGGN
jgi:hypothetical protein